MTKRTQLKKHIHTLEEIGAIMTAMKNLSLIEMNKVTQFIMTQKKMMESIDAVGKDFLHFYPNLLPHLHPGKPFIYILIGSERGFCGNFNDNLIHYLENNKQDNAILETKFIVVGRKLAMKLSDDERVFQIIDGPNTTEEIPNVIANLGQALEQISLKLSIKLRPGAWMILFNQEDKNEIQTTSVQPLMKFKEATAEFFSFPPLLTLTTETFLFEFINHYLFSMLYSVFYQSFFSENYRRLYHLEGSVAQLEKRTSSLKHNLNLLRQEEITQEIQVIMLSAEAILEET